MNMKQKHQSSQRWETLKMNVVLPVFTIIIFLLLWELVVGTGIISSAYLPGPSQLIRTFADKLWAQEPEGATLGQNILSSLKTSFSGFVVAIVIGIPLGLLMGFYEPVDRFVKPIFELIRPIPPIAWIPLTIVMLGIGFKAKMFIICFAAFVPCVMNSYTGVKLTNPTLINVARTCGASDFQIFTMVCISSSMQMVFAGVRLALSASWVTLVAAEMLAASSGLGYMIQMGRMLARPDLIVLGMLVIGLIGYLLPLCSIVLLLVGWMYLSFSKPELFPSPLQTWERFIKLLQKPVARIPLYLHILRSLRRVMIALAAACICGISFGVMIGWNKTLKATLGSLFEIIRPIPPIAWIPLITIWFGISEFPKVLIIFVGTFPIVVTNTYTGITMVDPLNLSVGKVFRASRMRLLTDFVLPAALPAIFSGIRMAIGVGWAIVLAAEMVGATSGVGFLIFRGNELRDMPLIFVCMFLIGIIGALLSFAASALERRLCPWAE